MDKPVHVNTSRLFWPTKTFLFYIRNGSSTTLGDKLLLGVGAAGLLALSGSAQVLFLYEVSLFLKLSGCREVLV